MGAREIANGEPSSFCPHRSAYPCTDQQPAEWLDSAMMQNDKAKHSISGVPVSVAASRTPQVEHGISGVLCVGGGNGILERLACSLASDIPTSGMSGDYASPQTRLWLSTPTAESNGAKAPDESCENACWNAGISGDYGSPQMRLWC